jgi:hypothetical protein
MSRSSSLILMRARTSRLEPRCALFAAAVIAAGCGEGPGAPGSDKAFTDALEISAAVEPVGLVAGDSFSVLITFTNPRQAPIPFLSPRDCLVEKTTVYQTMAYATDPASAPPVPLVGSGDAGCAYHPTFFVFQTDKPVVITVPMVAWRDDDSARAGLADSFHPARPRRGCARGFPDTMRVLAPARTPQPPDRTRRTYSSSPESCALVPRPACNTSFTTPRRHLCISTSANRSSWQPLTNGPGPNGSWASFRTFALLNGRGATPFRSADASGESSTSRGMQWVPTGYVSA